MICYKNTVILKKLNHFFKTIHSKKLEDCTYDIFVMVGSLYADQYKHHAMATGSINCTPWKHTSLIPNSVVQDSECYCSRNSIYFHVLKVITVQPRLKGVTSPYCGLCISYA